MVFPCSSLLEARVLWGGNWPGQFSVCNCVIFKVRNSHSIIGQTSLFVHIKAAAMTGPWAWLEPIYVFFWRTRWGSRRQWRKRMCQNRRNRSDIQTPTSKTHTNRCQLHFCVFFGGPVWYKTESSIQRTRKCECLSQSVSWLCDHTLIIFSVFRKITGCPIYY